MTYYLYRQCTKLMILAVRKGLRWCNNDRLTCVNAKRVEVLLEADMMDLKANPNRKATGTIIESSLDKGRGYVSTVLVSNGTLKIGDNVIAGTSWGRIKAMFNERNQRQHHHKSY